MQTYHVRSPSCLESTKTGQKSRMVLLPVFCSVPIWCRTKLCLAQSPFHQPYSIVVVLDWSLEIHEYDCSVWYKPLSIFVSIFSGLVRSFNWEAPQLFWSKILHFRLSMKKISENRGFLEHLKNWMVPRNHWNHQTSNKVVDF